jgi:hypothetical protein
LIWNFPDGKNISIKQSPDAFASSYHLQPVYEIPENTSVILENVQYLKFSLNPPMELTDKGGESNCKIYFEEL